MYYQIQHVTRFRYSEPVSQSMMEVRMTPRTETGQRCLEFELHTAPRATVSSHLDWQRNVVHAFDIPDQHGHLSIRTRALVELTAPERPEVLPEDAWDDLDAEVAGDRFWDWLQPSHFAQPTEALAALAHDLRVQREGDPLSTVRRVVSAIHAEFAYDQSSTEVDSSIDDALRDRHGVCQDFAHIGIALLRTYLGVPARYVSGYLYHRSGQHDRSAADATHAWIEAWLPDLGWVGMDPTNDLVAGDRHIRVALGRDYRDVPPTRGLFRGRASTELAVAVRVTPAEGPLDEVPEPEDGLYRATEELERLPETEIREQPQQ